MVSVTFSFHGSLQLCVLASKKKKTWNHKRLQFHMEMTINKEVDRSASPFKRETNFYKVDTVYGWANYNSWKKACEKSLSPQWVLTERKQLVRTYSGENISYWRDCLWILLSAFFPEQCSLSLSPTLPPFLCGLHTQTHPSLSSEINSSFMTQNKIYSPALI